MMARVFLRPSKAFGRRIDGLSQRIDNVERSVTELDARLTTRIDGLEQTVNGLRRGLTAECVYYDPRICCH
jgi:hypothetical protein